MTNVSQHVLLLLFVGLLAIAQTFVLNTFTDILFADSYWLITLPLSILVAFLSVHIYKFGHIKDTSEVNRWYVIISHWWGLLFNLFFGSILYYPLLVITGNYLIASIGLIGGLGAYFIGLTRAKNIKVKNLDLEFRNKKIELINKKVAFISDLHLGKILGQKFVTKVVAKLQQEEVDYLLIGGDMFDSVETNWNHILEPLKLYAEKVPTYYVTGNHDYYVNFETKLRPAIEAAGINLMENNTEIIDSIAVHGIPHHLSEPDFDFYDNFSNLSITKNKLNVLLYHEPSQTHSQYALDNGIDLQLSGHTHYGQLAPMNLLSWVFYGHFNYGLYRDEKNDAFQYTSSGIGSWGPPVRTTARPEVIILEI